MAGDWSQSHLYDLLYRVLSTHRRPYEASVVWMPLCFSCFSLPVLVIALIHLLQSLVFTPYFFDSIDCFLFVCLVLCRPHTALFIGLGSSFIFVFPFRIPHLVRYSC